MLLVAGGCNGGAEETGTVHYEPVQYSDEKGVLDCRVAVYASDHTLRGGISPSIEVYWDGREIFSGEIPNQRSALTGMVRPLIEITTSHGKHVLAFLA